MELSDKIDETTGRLAFNAGNIANFYYTVNFLESCAEIMSKHDEYHIAKKKVRAMTPEGTIGDVNAIKVF